MQASHEQPNSDAAKRNRKALVEEEEAEADTQAAMPPATIPISSSEKLQSGKTIRENLGSSAADPRPFSPSNTGQSQSRETVVQKQAKDRDHSLGEIKPELQTQTQTQVQNGLVDPPPASASQIEGVTGNESIVERSSVEKEQERPPFTPFFTIVNDLSGGEQSTHHPSRVHYIFADDDVSEVFTGAVGRAVERQASLGGRDEEDEEGQGDESAEEGEGEGYEESETTGEEGRRGHETETSSSSSAPQRREGTNTSIKTLTSRSRNLRKSKQSHQNDPKSRSIKSTSKEKGEPQPHIPQEPRPPSDRVLIIDISSSGTAITKISSLSPEWQVLSAEISRAPMWDKEGGEDGESPAGAGEGMMLKIEGVGLDLASALDSGRDGDGRGDEGGGKGKSKEREDGGGIGSGSGGLGSGQRDVMSEEEMHLLMEGFDRKMGILRRVVQRGSTESLSLPQDASIPTVSVPVSSDPTVELDRPGD